MLTARKALKLVSLGISDSSLIKTNTSSAVALSLRDTAQWFPDVPDERLYLNEASFPGISCKVFEYQPLTVMLYGGPQAVRLSKLIEIAVWVVDVERIYGIDFTYNIEVDGRKVHTLGRRGPFPGTEPRSYEHCDSSTDQRVGFQIDGPGGEIIDGVDIQQMKGLEIGGFRASLSTCIC